MKLHTSASNHHLEFLFPKVELKDGGPAGDNRDHFQWKSKHSGDFQ